jgi:hypothetical protein
VQHAVAELLEAMRRVADMSESLQRFKERPHGWSART